MAGVDTWVGVAGPRPTHIHNWPIQSEIRLDRCYVMLFLFVFFFS